MFFIRNYTLLKKRVSGPDMLAVLVNLSIIEVHKKIVLVFSIFIIPLSITLLHDFMICSFEEGWKKWWNKMKTAKSHNDYEIAAQVVLFSINSIWNVMRDY